MRKIKFSMLFSFFLQTSPTDIFRLHPLIAATMLQSFPRKIVVAPWIQSFPLVPCYHKSHTINLPQIIRPFGVKPIVQFTSRQECASYPVCFCDRFPTLRMSNRLVISFKEAPEFRVVNVIRDGPDGLIFFVLANRQTETSKTFSEV